MPKEMRNAEQIRQEIHDQIHANREVAEDGIEIGVPLPYWHEPDENGSNWNMGAFGNPGGYMPLVAALVMSARERYLLEH